MTRSPPHCVGCYEITSFRAGGPPVCDDCIEVYNSVDAALKKRDALYNKIREKRGAP